MDAPAMHQSARFRHTASPQSEATRDQRDPVVVQAIANVASQQHMEEWWALAPGVRTHAIYDEIRRLDRAWADRSAEPVENDAGNPRYQLA
jgi:hypothetical protein